MCFAVGVSFVGVLAAALQHLLDRRTHHPHGVAVGGRGVGKTALALRIARHLCARSKFCRILHLDLRPESEAIEHSTYE